MSTDALRTDFQPVAARLPVERGAAQSIRKDVERLLRPLASLRLTVVLFALAIVLILVGTLAQTRADVWVVLRTYFRAWYAWVPFQVLFPKSFFPNVGSVPGGFYFPGGFTIGVLMAVNLLAAHGLRFKIQASGARLWTGLGVIAAGAALTWLVIVTQQDSASLTGFSSSDWQPVWLLLKVLLAGIWATCAYRLFTAKEAPTWQRWVLSVVGIAAGGIFCWLMYLYFTDQEWPLGGSSMRILWQLMKATAAAGVLLAGCVLVFRKRGGIVLLHSGILLMMSNELVVDRAHVETVLTIREGESANWSHDIRKAELAVIDKSDPVQDRVVVVPESILRAGEVIRDERLPFDVRLDEYFVNSALRDVGAKDANPATAGNGLDILAVWKRPGTGTDVDAEVDYPAGYITLLDKATGKELGTYLAAALLNEFPSDVVPPERIRINDKKYDLSLRFERHYKPYSVHLVDVRKDDYPGTNTARNYSSDVRLVDESAGVDRPVKIWMNNPHRYGGDTFYQTRYHRDAKGELTVLSVVTNTGWMIPYVACMIVVVGMFAQFLITLLRFITRRSQVPMAAVVVEPRAKRKGDPAAAAQASGFEAWLPRFFPLLVVLVFGGWALSKLRTPSADSGAMDFYAAGRLPIMYQGRAKPLDTLARQTMCVMSNRQTSRMEVPKDEVTLAMKLFGDGASRPQPAIKWLFDVIAASPKVSEQHWIIRIDNTDVLNTLGLEPRKGFRYSIAEIKPKYDDFVAEGKKAAKIDEENRSTYEKKLLEVDERIRAYTLLIASFWPTPLPKIPTEEEFNADQQKVMQLFAQLRSLRERLPEVHADLDAMNPPRAVPDPDSKFGWTPLSAAKDADYFDSLNPQHKRNPAVEYWDAIVAAYRAGSAREFNRAVDRYQSYLDQYGPESLADSAPKFEAFFNNAEPFYHAAVLYLFAFVLSALAWLGWSRPLNRAAFWLLAFTFVFHTVALVMRIYITGRPPVTNLYSSAVFIGWGCVLLGLAFELVYRMGLGNTVAAVAGASTLIIAHLLMTQAPADRGDTMAVLQAVLDTQFWLATHVVCVTMGYATTFMAGLFGLVYVLRGVFTRSLTADLGKDLTRMTYGTICFAILFSFFGTVLGGLWADDSWGRFWGWDPKENGALIIVLWNSLVLHARWGGIVKDRGLAVLAIGGNIVTAWSWFGVNELRVGLHSYGFTEGALFVLGAFIGSQLLAIALGSIPKKAWASASNINATA